MMPKYIDIHCHLSFKDYDRDREEIIDRLEGQGISAIGVGVDLESSRKEVALAKKHQNLFACVGLHPADNRSEKFDDQKFEELVSCPKVVAVGECGLDYSRFPPSRGFGRAGKIRDSSFEKERKRQVEFFEKQVEFAVKHGKPLMIHARDAYDDVLGVLKSFSRLAGLAQAGAERKSRPRGNVHFFTGDTAVARSYLDIGFTLSFSGVITFAPYDEVVRYVPLESMHAETDAPFAAPIPFRGRRNEPSYVVEVVKKIAEIKKMDMEAVRRKLLENARSLFELAD
ncbi:MAG: TatD family hydrolase [Candidatus Taylorbacteria bacterium]|nr:TatD family hydrolase [Candidatus Taylorbacteria bacterium]